MSNEALQATAKGGPRLSAGAVSQPRRPARCRRLRKVEGRRPRDWWFW